MSLIVAKKCRREISIVSDTKLTYENQGTSISLDDPLKGVIKSIILHKNYCISFAGELTEAIDSALLQIANWDYADTVKILAFLTELHFNSNYKTEFILAVGKPDPLIYKIKAGECSEVPTAWIGDQAAFNRFQESFLGIPGSRIKLEDKEDLSMFPNPPAVIIRDVAMIAHGGMEELFSKMNYAMDDVIADEKITTVGGFKSQIHFSEKFLFMPYQKGYASYRHFRADEQVVIAPAEAAEGGYSINFLGGSEDNCSVALHIRQGNIGIVYNRKSSGLMKPLIFHMEEADFNDYIYAEYNIFSNYPTPVTLDVWYNQAKEAYANKECEKAILNFEKIMPFAKVGQPLADLLFRCATAYYSQGKYEKAQEYFQKAVYMMPEYSVEIDKLFERSGIERDFKINEE